jgi:hypothetical protein
MSIMHELHLSKCRRSAIFHMSLLFAVVVIHCIANIGCRTIFHDVWFWSLDYDLAICGVGLLSWWVVFGCRNILLGLSVWIAGITVLFALSVFPYCYEPPVHMQEYGWLIWTAIFGDATANSVLSAPMTLFCIAFVGRILRHRIVVHNMACTSHDEITTGNHRGRFQFSIRDMFIFVTIVAASISVLVSIQPYPEWIPDGIRAIPQFGALYYISLLSVIKSASVTLGASYLVLGRRNLSRRCAVFALAVLFPNMILHSLIICNVNSFFSFTFIWEFAPIILISTTSFFLIRCAGYREFRTGWPRAGTERA